ncbi:MAG: VTC domain-containing protein [Bacteroidales bacterium]
MLRVEKKYLVPNERMDELRRRISSFVRPDIYTTNHCNIPQYTVRSIYFDSRDFACYSEKREGIMLRRKFRIRGYNDGGEENRVVMEIKRKIDSRQKKYRAFVRFDDIEKLFQEGDLEKYVIENGSGTNALEDAGKFMYHIKKGLYIPTCLVAYEREAYHGKLDSGVRVTFDKNIRSRIFPEMNTLYDDTDTKILFKNHFVIEIKYFNNGMPSWARAVVQEFRLRNDAISKYTIGVDVCKEKTITTY